MTADIAQTVATPRPKTRLFCYASLRRDSGTRWSAPRVSADRMGACAAFLAHTGHAETELVRRGQHADRQRFDFGASAARTPSRSSSAAHSRRSPPTSRPTCWRAAGTRTPAGSSRWAPSTRASRWPRPCSSPLSRPRRASPTARGADRRGAGGAVGPHDKVTRGAEQRGPPPAPAACTGRWPPASRRSGRAGHLRDGEAGQRDTRDDVGQQLGAPQRQQARRRE